MLSIILHSTLLMDDVSPDNLVQQDRVCIGNLLLRFIGCIRRAMLLLQLPLNVFCVNDSDNGVKMHSSL